LLEAEAAAPLSETFVFSFSVSSSSALIWSKARLPRPPPRTFAESVPYPLPGSVTFDSILVGYHETTGFDVCEPDSKWLHPSYSAGALLEF
jgi:hypothetical protein